MNSATLDLHIGTAILRVQEGFDYTGIVADVDHDAIPPASANITIKIITANESETDLVHSNENNAPEKFSCQFC